MRKLSIQFVIFQSDSEPKHYKVNSNKSFGKLCKGKSDFDVSTIHYPSSAVPLVDGKMLLIICVHLRVKTKLYDKL